MRILMLSWRGPRHPRAGGAEHYTRRVLADLVRRGHQATWFCEGPQRQSLDGIEVIAGPRLPAIYPAGALFLLQNHRRFDLVVDQINVTGFLAPLYSPIPVLALIHQLAGDVWSAELRPPWRSLGPPLEAAGLAAYRAVPFVTVSQSTLGDLRAAGWRGPGFVAYNGIETVPAGSLPPKEAVPTLAFLGRWQARAKRPEHALAAFARVRAVAPAARLWAIGRGRPGLAAAPGVTLLRDVTDAERDALLARAWLLLATSVREGWGRMVLEAAAVGTPAAVYDTPGLGEAGRAVGATVVAPDPAALGAAALDLLSSGEHLADLGAEARRRAAAFTWERTADVWERALAASLPARG